jgi:hypothetical protein
LEEERVGQSAISRLVTPKPYQYNLIFNRIDQKEWDRRRTDPALMREDRRLDISPLPTKEKVKNKHVQQVDELIATTVKETLLHYIKSNALERTVEKRINKEMARSSWDMNLEEPCEGMS